MAYSPHRALDAQLPVGKVVLHFRNGHGILSSSQDSGTVNLAKGSSLLPEDHPALGQTPGHINQALVSAPP